jgi:hypothetical protein
VLVGADVAALRRLGEAFESAGESLAATRAELDRVVGAAAWQGPDGASFTASWEGELRRHLARATELVRETGLDVRRQADQQERASAAGGATGVGAQGPVGGSSSSTGHDSTTLAAAPSPQAMAVVAQAPGDARATPEEILTGYQVSDGKVLKNWEPDWPASMFTDPLPQITEKEASMLNGLSLLSLKSFQDIHDRAFELADERFEPGDQNDNHNDAFRHAYWNALMTRKYGEAWAEDYATAHEQIPGNPPAREAMDLYNNEVGRRIAAQNPDADVYQLADLVEKAVRDGEMVVVDPEGNLAYSNEVAVGETGHARPADPLPGKDPEFNDESSDS